MRIGPAKYHSVEQSIFFGTVTPSVVRHEILIDESSLPDDCGACKMIQPDSPFGINPHLVYLNDPQYPDDGLLEGETDPADVIFIDECPSLHELKQGAPLLENEGTFLMNTWYTLWNAPTDTEFTRPPMMMVCHAFRCPNVAKGAASATVVKKCSNNFLRPYLVNPNIVADNAVIIAAGAAAWKAINFIATGNLSVASINSVHGRAVKLEIEGRTFTVVPVLKGNYVLANMDTQAMAYAEDYAMVFTACNERENLDVFGVVELLERCAQNRILYEEMPPYVELEALVEMMSDVSVSEGCVSFDIESRTKNLATHYNYPTLMGFGLNDNEYVQFTKDSYAAVPYILRRLKENGILICGQNIKFDIMSCYRFRLLDSVEHVPYWRDTHWMQSLVDENKSAFGKADLKTMMGEYFNWPDYSVEIDNYVKHVTNGDYGRIPLDKLLPYHAADLIGTWMLDKHLYNLLQTPEVSEHWIVDYVDFYSETDRNLCQMSMNGMTVDPSYFNELTELYQGKINDIHKRFQIPLYSSLARKYMSMDTKLRAQICSSLMSFPFDVDEHVDNQTWKFNPNSADHGVALIAALVPNDVKIKLVQLLGKNATTAAGRFSLNKENMPIIINFLKEKQVHTGVIQGLESISELKKMVKLFGTYIEGMRANIWGDTKVRSSFVVAGAATGRLSSRNPNLQNLPRSKEMKNMFLTAKPGDNLLMQFDLSQAEVRGLGILTGDTNLAQAYADGLDMHKYTASKAFNVDYEDVSKDQRQSAKAVQFGAIYGSSAAGIAAVTGQTIADAETMLDNYFTGFPNVLPWIEEQHNMVDDSGYVVCGLGRKRHLPSFLSHEQNSADLKREGQNAPIQCFAAEFTLVLLNDLCSSLAEGGMDSVKLVNTVHDSIVLDVPCDCIPAVYQIYQQCISRVNTFFRECMDEGGSIFRQWIDMVGDVEVGPRYGEMYPMTLDEVEKDVTKQLVVECQCSDEDGHSWTEVVPAIELQEYFYGV